jgi:hypothetical protein
LVSASAVTKYAHASTGRHSRSSGTPLTSTGTGARVASASSAAPSPRSLSSAGWMPRASSRSSSMASCASSRAWRHQLGRARGIARDPRLGEAEGQGHGDQPLLGAVVEIALDAPALFVGGGEDALPGVAQVVDPRAQLARTPRLGGSPGKRIWAIEARRRPRGTERRAWLGRQPSSPPPTTGLPGFVGPAPRRPTSSSRRLAADDADAGAIGHQLGARGGLEHELVAPGRSRPSGSPCRSSGSSSALPWRGRCSAATRREPLKTSSTTRRHVVET